MWRRLSFLHRSRAASAKNPRPDVQLSGCVCYASCVNHTIANQLIADAAAQERTALSEIESKKILDAIGIPVAIPEPAASADDAVRIAQRLGFPVVLKVLSPDVTHKSEVGGVELNLKSEAEVRDGFERIRRGLKAAMPGARFEGVAVQPMAPAGVGAHRGHHARRSFRAARDRRARRNLRRSAARHRAAPRAGRCEAKRARCFRACVARRCCMVCAARAGVDIDAIAIGHREAFRIRRGDARSEGNGSQSDRRVCRAASGARRAGFSSRPSRRRSHADPRKRRTPRESEARL